MGESEAVGLARRLFLDEGHAVGCAETAFITLKEAFGLADPLDSSPAMALNGGVAYSGGICGAISGGAMALGMLAEQRLRDHAAAKRITRELVARVLDDFRVRHGAVDCRDLIGIDLRAPGAHDEFMAGNLWRERCMPQIEFVVGALAPLADETTWAEVVRGLDARRS